MWVLKLIMLTRPTESRGTPILFYDVYFWNASFRLTDVLDKTKLQFHSFDVGAMRLYANTPYLFIGVNNLGVLVYDSNRHISLMVYDNLVNHFEVLNSKFTFL